MVTKQSSRLGRHRPYPAYKDSGVEWLGEIPAHWDTKPLKRLASLNPEDLGEDTDPALEMVYIDIGGVDSLGKIIDREHLTFAAAPTRARRVVRDGDVIVSTVRTYLRAIAPIRDPDPGMVVSTGFAVVRPADELFSSFVAYALRAPFFVEEVVAHSKGVSFPAINESEMSTFHLVLPPKQEQRAIAVFLDQETARIDSLRAKKQQLIELLQEQRTALITSAVTKGLDPNVSMKDSGVEWLGEIPAHWITKRVRQLCSRVTDGAHISPDISSADFPFVSTVDIHGGVIEFDGCLWTSATSYGYMERTGCRPHAGDVLFSKDGTIGTTAVVSTDREFAVASSLVILSPNQCEIDSRWLNYWLNGLFIKEQVELLLSGAALRRISVTKVGTLAALVPPLHEQRDIAAFLDQETVRIDALVAKVREAIQRLNELRTALISAAVTGKIDVRDEAA